MTDEQINIAIIEVISAIQPWRFAKDYVNDLNAMHEAEKTLDTVMKRLDYWDHLYMPTDNEFQACHATARQRAEAFLRTLGKWEEVKP